MRRYGQINDFIIFGSVVKGKEFANDIDIAVIMDKKDLSIFKSLSAELPEAHLELVASESLLKTRLSLNLLMEGYSIQKRSFLRDLLGIKPVKMFIYNLKGFTRSRKAQFSMALTKNLKLINGKRIAAGAVIIPIDKSGYFDEFLDTWQIKYSTVEWTMF